MRTTVLIILQLAASGADAFYTNRGMDFPQFHEHDPIAKPFIKTTPDRIAYFSVTAAIPIVGTHLLRKHHHEKLADGLAVAFIADSATGAASTATHIKDKP